MKDTDALHTKAPVKRKTYSGKFKAKVVAELLTGKKELDQLAREHNLHPNQIKNWKSYLLKHAGEVLADKRMGKKN